MNIDTTYLNKFTIQKKVKHEFQEVGLLLQEYYGKENRRIIWPLFYKHPLSKIKLAHQTVQNKGTKDIKYLLGVIKRI